MLIPPTSAGYLIESQKDDADVSQPRGRPLALASPANYRYDYPLSVQAYGIVLKSEYYIPTYELHTRGLCLDHVLRY
jgi:hypothetical protein